MNRGCKLRPLLVCLSLFMYNVCVAADNEEPKLRARVTEFFSAVQSHQMNKAEQFVVEKAREKFRNQSPGKLVGFKIESVKMEEGRSSALVEMSYTIIAPTIVRQVNIPDTIRWKLIDGGWFYDPDDPPPSMGEKFQEYYYKKVGSRSAGSPKSARSANRLSKFQVHFEKDLMDIGVVERGKVITLHYPFTNQSQQDVEIQEFYFRGANYLKNTTGKNVFKPKENGEIVVELNTADLRGPLDHSFFVEFQPAKELIPLKIRGKVVKATTPAESKPAKKSAATNPKAAEPAVTKKKS